MKKINKIWEGNFSNFETALKFKRGSGFKSNKWINDQINILNKCIQNIKHKKKISQKHTMRFRSFINILNNILKKKKKLNILDIGGGIGIGYLYILQEIKKNIKYTIIEIPQFIKKIGKNKIKKIIYKSKIDKKKYDFVNCCSSFQYVKNWRREIKKFSYINSDYIYFADLFAGNIKTFVTLQNYYESKIPHWFLNFEDFNNEMLKYNFRLISKRKMITKRLKINTTLPMNNFKKSLRLPYTLNLLYKKN